MLSAWPLVALAVVGVATGAVGRLLEHPSSQKVNSESSMLACIQLCHSNLIYETPPTPGDAHLQPLSPSNPVSLPALPLVSSSSSPQGKRSYAIEHFRWGKPVGQKGLLVKGYTSTGVDEASAKVFPGEMRKQELAGKIIAAEDTEMVQELVEEEQEKLPVEVHKKKDATYKIKHFRWGGPPASKRNVGFTRSHEAQPEAAAHVLQKRQQRWTGAGETAVREEEGKGREG